MRKELKYQIKDKVFNRQDIIRLFKLLFEFYEKSKNKQKKFSIKLSCEDSESYESENENIDNILQLLDTNKISSIRIHFYGYSDNSDKAFRLTLHQGDERSFNEFSIEGEDQGWVNSKYHEVVNLLNSIKPQNQFFSRHRGKIFHLMSINLGFFLLRFLSSTMLGADSDTIEVATETSSPLMLLIENSLIAKIVLAIVFSWTIGAWALLMIWMPIANNLSKLWPSIEFNFGPEHLRTPSNMRCLLWILLTLFIIPIFLQFLIF